MTIRALSLAFLIALAGCATTYAGGEVQDEEPIYD